MRLRQSFYFGGAVLALAMALPASAKTTSGPIAFENAHDFTMKVCQYKTNDIIMEVPQQCLTIGSKKRGYFKNRLSRGKSYRFRVFRIRKVIDRLLVETKRTIPGNILKFEVNENDLIAVRDEARPNRPAPRYSVPVRTWKVGDKILANWQGDAYWYAATITARNGSNYQIRYADGSTENLHARYISGDYIRRTTGVSGNWLGKGQWYRGRITSRNGNSVKIIYDDGDKETTTLSKIRLAFGDLPKVPPNKYMMRVCNNINERVYFAVSFSLSQSQYVTEGWWNIDPKGCINVDIAKRWRRAGIPEDLKARTYISGETRGILGGAIKKTWYGNDPRYTFCVNTNKGPYFKNTRFRPNTTVRVACRGPGKELVKMSEVPFPTNGTTMRFNFDGK